jgi:hypothetical protein
MSLTPFVQGSSIYLGYPDAAGWLIVALAMLNPHPFLWAMAPVLIQLNDERGLLALPFALAVIIYPKRRSLYEMYRASRGLILGLILGFIAGQVLRYFIATGVIGGKPIEGSLYIAPQVSIFCYFILGLLVSYKALWPFAVYVIGRTLSVPAERVACWFWFAVIGWLLFVILLCFSYVADFWRSLGCLFPVFILLLLQAETILSPSTLRRCIFGVTLIMVVLPQLQQMGNNLTWIRPLPIAVYEFMIGKSILSGVRG